MNVRINKGDKTFYILDWKYQKKYKRNVHTLLHKMVLNTRDFLI